MTQRMSELADEILHLQAELDREIQARRASLGVSIRGRIVEFEHGITLQHRQLRKGLGHFLRQSSFSSLITAPVIYAMIIPIAMADLCTSFYQQVCFRVYRIPRVNRSDYIAFDRHQLHYLNWIEKINCIYCAYANGVIGYVREAASRTEQYWCPIKHALRIPDPHKRYFEFLEYGDADGYRTRLQSFRDKLSEENGPPPLSAPASPSTQRGN